MIRIDGSAATEHAGKYIRQLCKHWSHKFEIDLDDERGIVHLPNAVVTLRAAPTDLIISIEAGDAATAERMQEVVASHVDRFSFREGPLSYRWLSAQA